jgi:hypothetical protein
VESIPTRRLWCALLVLLSAALPACDSRATPQPPKPPDSPVGHFESKLYRYEGRRPKLDETIEDRWETTHILAVEVRADHTFRYEWRSLVGPGGKDGRLEGTWRPDPTSGHWLFRPTGDGGAERSVLFLQGELVRPGEAPSGKPLAPDQWAFPMPDTTTGEWMDSSVFMLRTPE